MMHHTSSLNNDASNTKSTDAITITASHLHQFSSSDSDDESNDQDSTNAQQSQQYAQVNFESNTTQAFNVNEPSPHHQQ